MKIVTGKKRALTVPTSAVFRRGGKTYVWLASVPGRLRGPKKYQCPMHPDVMSDKPGECPKCGMQLQSVSEPKQGLKADKNTYTCAMHPEVLSDKPGKCSKCGMNLIPKKLESKVSELVAVKVGLTNPDYTEIIKGLVEGDEVIYTGYGDLQPEVPVVGVDWTAEGLDKLPFASEVGGNKLLSSNNWVMEQMVGHVMLKISVSPSPPKSKNNEILVSLEKHSGGKVNGAKITAKSSMPSMDMLGPDLKAKKIGDGLYRLKSNFKSGLWKMDLLIKGASKETIRLDVEVEVP